MSLRLRLGHFIYRVPKCNICCSKTLVGNRCCFVQLGNFQKAPDVNIASERRLTLMTVGQKRTEVKFWWHGILSGGECLCFICQDKTELWLLHVSCLHSSTWNGHCPDNLGHPPSHPVPIIPAGCEFQSLKGGICTVFSCHWFGSYYDIFGIVMKMNIQFQQAVCSTDGWVDASLHCAPLRLVRYQQQTDSTQVYKYRQTRVKIWAELMAWLIIIIMYLLIRL